MSKKYLSITFALAVLLSFFGFDFGFEKANNRMNYQAVGAENSAEDEFVAKYQMFEFSSSKKDYIRPYLQVDKLTNGASNIGTMTIVGDSIEDKGYQSQIETNLFDYNAYSVQSEVTLKCTFQYNNLNPNDYHISNLPNDLLEGWKDCNIRQGIAVILKRRQNENGWTIVSKNAITHDNTVIEYKPLGIDVDNGTFYQYVAAYQYYSGSEKDGRRYDVYQRSTVYLATGGTSLKFVTGTSKEKTYTIPSLSYQNDALGNDGTFVINGESLKEGEEKVSLGTFKIDSEILKATETKNDFCLDFPEYVYNGINDKITICFEKNIPGNLTPATRNVSNISTSDLQDKITTVSLKKEPVESSCFRLEALQMDSSSNLVWGLFDDIVRYDQNDNTVSVEISGYKRFTDVDFRAMYISSYSSGGSIVTICNVAYFRVRNNTSKYRSAFRTDEGFDSSIKLNAQADLKDTDLLDGVTLADGAASFSNVAVIVPSSSYKVYYSYNGGEYVDLGNKRVFEEAGKYRLKVINDFNDVSYKTIYIVDIKEDNGKSTYFKDGKFIDDNKRLYDPESSIPSYAPGAQFQINGDQFKPGIYGDISLVNGDGSLKKLVDIYDLHTLMTGTLTEIGQYQATIYTSDPTTTGDHIKYTIRFNIKNGSDFVPRINYDLLHSGVDCRNLMGKGYVVKFQSKGTGSYLFTFPYTQKGFHDAWDFSERVEARKVVYSEDKKHYTYNGVVYDSKFELYDDIHENASKLISTTLINKKFSVEGDGYELKNIAEKPIDHDIYVVTSEDVFRELSTDLVYINDYMFQQVREYESSSVEIIFPDGKTKKKIAYKVSVNSYLGESGIYTVIEKNPYGERRYQVAYCKNGDNKTTTTIRYFDQTNRIVETEFEKNSQTKNITTSSLIFKNIVDEIDPVTLVTVTRKEDNSVHYYSGEELIDCVIDYKGTYQIEFTNRMGYSFSMTANITGEKNSKGIMPHKDADSELSYCPIGHVKGVN